MLDLDKLTNEYNLVSNKTNALHTMSEQLLSDQNKLTEIGKYWGWCLNLIDHQNYNCDKKMCDNICVSLGEDIKQKLHYFTQVEHLAQRLNSSTMSVNSETFFNVLSKIDECLDYMRANVSLYYLTRHCIVLLLNILVVLYYTELYFYRVHLKKPKCTHSNTVTSKTEPYLWYKTM